MRKFTLLSLFCAGVLSLHAQAPEVRNQGPVSAPNSPTFAADVTILNATSQNQHRVKLAKGENQDVFSVIAQEDLGAGTGGVFVGKSTDGGATWTQVDTYNPAGTKYETVDISVSGNASGNYYLDVVGVNQNTATGTYTLYVDRYNAANGAFMGSILNIPNGQRKIYDVAIANDFASPAVGTSPYSIGVLYSTYSSSRDSIIFRGSTDAGASWTVKEVVATTVSYFRNVDLAYGKSMSGSNGRYFAAFDRFATSTALTGQVLMSRNASTVDGNWLTPYRLDSLGSAVIDKCANPQIALSYGTADNDSGGPTAVVAFSRYYGQNDWDVLSYVNMRAHFTSFWTRYDIDNGGTNARQPDVVYDPFSSKFFCAFTDSIGQTLTASEIPWNATGNTWIGAASGVNDQGGLTQPNPSLVVDPTNSNLYFAWSSNHAGANAVALFDAANQFVAATPAQPEAALNLLPVYPNPAGTQAHVRFTLAEAAPVRFTFSNVLGQVIETRDLGMQPAGEMIQTVSVQDLPAGYYMVRVDAGSQSRSLRFAVQH